MSDWTRGHNTWLVFDREGEKRRHPGAEQPARRVERPKRDLRACHLAQMHQPSVGDVAADERQRLVRGPAPGAPGSQVRTQRACYARRHSRHGHSTHRRASWPSSRCSPIRHMLPADWRSSSRARSRECNSGGLRHRAMQPFSRAWKTRSGGCSARSTEALLQPRHRCAPRHTP